MNTLTMAEPVVDTPPRVEPYRFTVDEYYRMCEEGIIAPEARVELIEGQIISMPAPGPPHAGTVDQLTQLLVTALAGRAIVRIQNALRLDKWNEPQPDVTLLNPRQDWYKTRQPGADDTFLVIEVSQISQTYDRDVKARLYAHFRVPEYWIIDVPATSLEVYRRPGDDGYHSMERFDDGTVSPISFPDLTIQIDSLFEWASSTSRT